MIRFLRYFFAISLALATLVFAYFNRDEIAVHVHIHEFVLPVGFLVFIAVLSGFLIGLFMGWLATISLKREIRTLEEDKQLAAEELSNLRKMPFNDE